MEQSYKKRPPRATANSPPVLSDMGEFYFINLVNVTINKVYILYINIITFSISYQRNNVGTKSII